MKYILSAYELKSIVVTVQSSMLIGGKWQMHEQSRMSHDRGENIVPN